MFDELHVRLATPVSPELDTFASGNAEVDRYFRERRWFDTGKGRAAPPTYEVRVGAGGEVIGFLSLAFGNRPHPADGNPDKGRYLVIYVVGLVQSVQGSRARERGPTRAEQVFEWVTRQGQEHPGCVGLYLWVRADNHRAVGFYEKVGFQTDSGGPVQRDKGPAHLTMRKLF